MDITPIIRFARQSDCTKGFYTEDLTDIRSISFTPIDFHIRFLTSTDLFYQCTECTFGTASFSTKFNIYIPIEIEDEMRVHTELNHYI